MKRARAPNFTRAEISHLLRLVEKYPIVDNKKTDGATTKAKQEAWQLLEADYNRQTNYFPRTVENLIACYKNHKTKTKKMHSIGKMANRASLSLPYDVDDQGQEWATQESTSSDDCKYSYNSNSSYNMMKEVKKEDTDLDKAINSTEGGPQPSCSCDSDVMAEQQGSIHVDVQIDPLDNPMERTQDIHKGNKKYHSSSHRELAGDKKELVRAQRTLVEMQIEREKLEIELAKEKLAFENKKNSMTLDFLDEKYKLELSILKNKTI